MNKQNLPPHGKKIILSIIVAIALISGYFYFSSKFSSSEETKSPVNEALAAKFDFLSKNGNSSCSAVFRDSITTMADDARLRGSCCSPMSMHRYSEQVEALKKYEDISEIPPDPYDIEAGLAKKLMAHYGDQLTSEGQEAYDYAMQNSDEKGPCCCKCWRWYVYGGLGKILIKNYQFTGQQVADVWNLSDGCGGDSDHHHTT